MRPLNLTFLRSGKSIGAQKGFAETFNWLVRAMRNLTGDGITAKVDWMNGGDNPVVRSIGQIGGSNNWVITIDNEDHTAAVVITADDYPAGAIVLENEVTLPTTAGTTAITLHVKYPVKVGSGANYSTVVVVSSGTSHADNAGDVYRATIADVVTTVETVEGRTVARHTLANVRKHAKYNEAMPALGVLAVYWAVAAGASTGFTPHIRATNNAPICGGSLADAALPTTCTAWYLIDCTGASPVPSVVTSKNPAAGKVYVQAYNFIDGDMADDLRANLSNAVFYP